MKTLELSFFPFFFSLWTVVPRDFLRSFEREIGAWPAKIDPLRLTAVLRKLLSLVN